jgi:hypothetical protein
MGDIYRNNLNLQKKLDEIKMKGTGISFYSYSAERKSARSNSSHRFASIPKIRGPNEQGLMINKSPKGRGSLNFNH